MTTFVRVQEILNGAITAWIEQHHRQPNLGKHDVAFGWVTRDQLINSVAFDVPLITQQIIESRNGDSANIVVALRTGVPGFPRMPIRGPYVAESEIQEIVDWINSGAPA